MTTASRLAGLRAMADQDVSPNEAEIARAKLAEMGAGDREPPRRPPAAPSPGAGWDFTSGTTSTTASWSMSGTSTWIRFSVEVPS